MKSKIDYYLIRFKSFIISILTFNKKINNKKIVIDNFLGKGYGDNLKYIVEELHNYDDSLEFVWLVRDMNEEIPSFIKKVRYGSFSSLYAYSTSKLWIDNVRNNIKPIKKTNQVYLQTWHGPFSSKKIEAMALDTLSSEYVKAAKIDGSIVDGILSNSKMQDNQYSSYFWLNDNVEILKFGFPRNDYLLLNKDNHKLIKNIKSSLGFDNDEYLILYAPTFRDDFSTDCYMLDFNNILSAFKSKVKKDCKLLVRLHPNVQKYSKNIKYNENIIDVTSYPNMQDLALACDSIVSDYSSTLFDFAIQGKPAYICALDLEKYKSTRGLVDEYSNYPFPFAQSSNELIYNINRFDYISYKKDLNNFFDFYPIYDKGDATFRIKEWIINKIY